MTWQATLLLVFWASWAGLHASLGKKRLLRTLACLLALDILVFAAFMVWLQGQTGQPSSGAAVALGLFLGVAILLVPAAVGAFSFWKHGTTRAL
ncbi:hypothetical protein ASD76_02650 [Altererythrobacter sp. Root672]|nr:hypothetical protein ASD76_02650 [Altererythrobacter sp. Root672]